MENERAMWLDNKPSYNGSGIKCLRATANIQFVLCCIGGAIIIFNTIQYMPVFAIYTIVTVFFSFLLKSLLLVIATIGENQLIQKTISLDRDIIAKHLN